MILFLYSPTSFQCSWVIQIFIVERKKNQFTLFYHLFRYSDFMRHEIVYQVKTCLPVKYCKESAMERLLQALEYCCFKMQG